ncbi:hypothetical protein MKQ70_12580 [Chitinophaga sedimenti]|uniref:hypothetical protein n=1 Tax=Chitinophaga sedimenti TaxID=2033606 RepID=UPI002003C453|nr:hypothetical protein [Chitinophaga sedimenti]MCK7555808.1 hypothetical protein [Chitinophaga sedimenti]
MAVDIRVHCYQTGGGGGGGTGGNDPYEYWYDWECECNRRFGGTWWIGDDPSYEAYDVWVAPPEDGRTSINLNNYLQNFDHTAGSTYKITLAVDQPTPGSRTVYTIETNPLVPRERSSNSRVDIGHAFLTIEQTKPNGTIVKRSLGFYPDAIVFPKKPQGDGVFYNDEQQYFDVSLTTTLSESNFFAVINYLKSHATEKYNLNTKNCVSKCVEALNSVGLNIPETEGEWPFGAGMNPGDLGEDIRGMILGPSQTRNLSGGTAPPNQN